MGSALGADTQVVPAAPASAPQRLVGCQETPPSATHPGSATSSPPRGRPLRRPTASPTRGRPASRPTTSPRRGRPASSGPCSCAARRGRRFLASHVNVHLSTGIVAVFLIVGFGGGFGAGWGAAKANEKNPSCTVSVDSGVRYASALRLRASPDPRTHHCGPYGVDLWTER
jgi:hypothetical protein